MQKLHFYGNCFYFVTVLNRDGSLQSCKNGANVLPTTGMPFLILFSKKIRDLASKIGEIKKEKRLNYENCRVWEGKSKKKVHRYKILPKNYRNALEFSKNFEVKSKILFLEIAFIISLF